MIVKSFCVNMMHENTYVVSDATRECVIIDCGCREEAERDALAGYIAGEGLSVRRLLCTHLHLDHTFGNEFVLDRYGVRAEANEGDRPLVEMIHYQAVAFGLGDDEAHVPTPDFTLHDGAEIRFGETTLRVVGTPGHSPGGVSLWCESEGVIFSGDSLLKGAYGATNLPGGRLKKLRRSIMERLFALPSDTVVSPGHGEPTTIGAERESNPILTVDN